MGQVDSAREALRRGGAAFSGATAEFSHAVQFYEREHFLVATVGDFLVEGLTSGEPVVVIATPAHTDALLSHLRARNISVERARRAGQLVTHDARAMLDTIMVRGAPDAQLFGSVAGELLARARRDGPHLRVRAYGEMADLLALDGNIEGAVQMETLWNELAATHAFSLLCAYALDGFGSGGHGAAFETVCRLHRRVAPTERYVLASEDDRLVEIAILQQRARALESEIEKQNVLERSLRDALAVAEEASRVKTEFLAAMSHELRTPLNAIGGYVQLVEMGLHGPVTEAQRDALARVQSNQRHLLALINDLLNLTTVESGRVELRSECVELARAIGEVTATLAPAIAARRLDCVIVPPDATLLAWADPDKLRQILFNVITNAVKFTPEGGRITIDSSADRAEVSVHVRDTGVGIPKGKLEQIFEPFVQLDACRHAPREGVGLGLSISRALARGMGGDLSATSRPGEGATFTLRLPQGAA